MLLFLNKNELDFFTEKMSFIYYMGKRNHCSDESV